MSKKFLLSILLLFLFINYSNSESKLNKNDSLKNEIEFLKYQIDKLEEKQKFNDEKIDRLGFIYYQKKNFWERNEVQLISLIIALLVAYFAAYISSNFNSEQVAKEKKQKYQGHLYILHTELYWHNHHLTLLRKSLNLLIEPANNIDYFPLKNPIFLFDIHLTDQILLTLTEYKEYDYYLVVLCTSYSNQIKSLNYSQNFENANELMKTVQDKKGNLKTYIESLEKNHLSKTQTTIYKIQSKLQKQLSHLPAKETLFKSFFDENT